MATNAKRILLLAAILVIGASAAFGADDPQEAGDAPVETAPVVLDGTALFVVRGIPSYSASRRAAAISDRISDLARDRSFDPATLAIVGGEHETRIGSGTKTLMRVSEADGEVEGIDRRFLAEVYLARVREAILAYRAARGRDALVASAERAGLATVVAVFVLFALRWAFRALRRSLERRYAGRTKAVTIRSFELMRAERIWQIVRGAIHTASSVCLLAMVVLYLYYTLALFPWTRGVAFQIDDWVFDPLAILGSGFVAKLPNLVFLGVLFFVVRYLLRLIHLFFSAVARREVEFGDFEPEWGEPTYKLVRIGVIAFALVVAYPYIPGSSSGAFKGVSLFIGVLFSLGSSSAISNVIAGYVMIYRRAFHEGDIVKIGEVTGAVARIRLQVTHLRTIKNEDVVIPNSTILNGEVVNYTTLAKTHGLILHATVGIGYETPWRQVEAMLLEAAARTEGLLRDPKPFVLETALGDFAVTYQINAYCDDPRGMAFRYAALHRNILDVFNEYGVQIMTPAYEGDPSEPKIVRRENWHTPPATGP